MANISADLVTYNGKIGPQVYNESTGFMEPLTKTMLNEMVVKAVEGNVAVKDVDVLNKLGQLLNVKDADTLAKLEEIRTGTGKVEVTGSILGKDESENDAPISLVTDDEGKKIVRTVDAAPFAYDKVDNIQRAGKIRKIVKPFTRKVVSEPYTTYKQDVPTWAKKVQIDLMVWGFTGAYTTSQGIYMRSNFRNENYFGSVMLSHDKRVNTGAGIITNLWGGGINTLGNAVNYSSLNDVLYSPVILGDQIEVVVYMNGTLEVGEGADCEMTIVFEG